MRHPTRFATMAITILSQRLYLASAESCFISPIASSIRRTAIRLQSRSSDEETGVVIGVSRLNTLQSLLSERGAPGSRGCKLGGGDLVPISTLSARTSDEFNDLHPHLFPLARSQSTGNVVCALRRAYADDADYDSISLAAPWPIVESAVGLPGMRLLSLNSEHMMRRIAAGADSSLEEEEAKKIIGIYNDGLGSGAVKEKSMDFPYESGSVKSLGYGLDKYVLLRVGPFPDLYETMANQHLSRGDEDSSLIAAEASNGKFGGFGSTFAFYAKLLGSLSQRAEEKRDAARMCLRMPLPSMGLTKEDFVDVAKMAEFAAPNDSADEALAKMLEMYEKIREHEKEDNSGDKTPKQMAMEDANYLLDVACLTGQKYGEVRGHIAKIYRDAGMEEMATFVERS
mmetsp:Transcript_10202/g.20996  ORF Transcript_10202/g.20996 Transcript_10202/m.20996 type:complete len:399 (+) Transcript_10202:89-1285(+)